MNKKNLCIIASIIIGISGFFPYVSVSIFGFKVSKSLIEGGDGYFLIALALIALICSIKEKYIAAGISGIVSLILFFFENSTLNESLDDEYARSLIQNEAGYYLLVCGSLALIAFAFLARSEKRKREASQPADMGV